MKRNFWTFSSCVINFSVITLVGACAEELQLLAFHLQPFYLTQHSEIIEFPSRRAFYGLQISGLADMACSCSLEKRLILSKL